MFIHVVYLQFKYAWFNIAVILFLFPFILSIVAKKPAPPPPPPKKEEFVDSENKIMKKIAKAVLINKTC